MRAMGEEQSGTVIGQLANYIYQPNNVIRIWYKSIVPNQENVELHLKDLEGMIYTHSGVRFILDATHASGLAMKEVIRIRQWMQAYEPKIKENTQELIFVIPNSITRLTYLAIFQFRKPPVPFKLFPDLKMANQYIYQDL
jgi:hypothetical protein